MKSAYERYCSKSLFEFSKVKWLQLTSEVGKSVICRRKRTCRLCSRLV